MALLEIRNLSVEFATARGPFRAVDGVDLTLDAGEVLGVVGESGSGKSVSMLAVMGLIGYPGKVTADRMRFGDVDLQNLSTGDRRKLVGKDMAMVFQEPMSSLNPCFTVGWQIGEALKVHNMGDRSTRRRRVIELLHQVGIPAPETRLGSFPHQLSGGMNQRVMIAMALACDPKLIIADEPTTALDVTIQKQILDLLVSLQRDRGMALVLITHDMGVIAETAQRVQVMYAGQMVEEQAADQLFAAPRHPYTAALLDALPERALGKRRLPTIPGMVPGIDDRPRGCLFSPRCRFVTEHCVEVRPGLDRTATDRPGGAPSRCHYPLDPAGHPRQAEPQRAGA
ncbi:MAG TPA: oligopeptide/dipeptide ABC transporter ATP-binding protein [Stellaceae bacterium]|nr:oligopeptide/dipeptide ABC transporter ATP-binding protein [Stellaceae bacterium]